ncbi:MAG: chemotaxis protein CheW [Oscillospiraceae bacterium]|jgi:purine-binding chemotaxis protein CheW|nr:chemotaxis protein CheW [Oscillospiraceae bacterium]
MADNIAEIDYAVPVTDEMENMYLNFSVGSEIYGIEIRYVIQIIGMQEITEMPEMPHGTKGFINLRGNVIPVVSVRLRFGKPEEEYTQRTCIIVVHVDGKEIGLIVDGIQETITIEPDNISPPPVTDINSQVPYIMGIAKLTGGRNAILIQVQKLFLGAGD